MQLYEIPKALKFFVEVTSKTKGLDKGLACGTSFILIQGIKRDLDTSNIGWFVVFL